MSNCLRAQGRLPWGRETASLQRPLSLGQGELRRAGRREEFSFHTGKIPPSLWERHEDQSASRARRPFGLGTSAPRAPALPSSRIPPSQSLTRAASAP